MANENELEDKSGDDDADEGLEAPRKGKKLLLIIILLLLLLGGAGAGLYFTGTLDKLLGKTEDAADTPPADAPAEAKDGEKGEADATKGPVFYALPEFIVNLNTAGTNAGTSFMKVTVVLDLPSEEVAAKVKTLEPRIVDDFNTYLRELRATDLSGSAGIYRLREELLMRMNKIMAPDQVNDILFKEMLVQ